VASIGEGTVYEFLEGEAQKLGDLSTNDKVKFSST